MVGHTEAIALLSTWKKTLRAGLQGGGASLAHDLHFPQKALRPLQPCVWNLGCGGPRSLQESERVGS